VTHPPVEDSGIPFDGGNTDSGSPDSGIAPDGGTSDGGVPDGGCTGCPDPCADYLWLPGEFKCCSPTLCGESWACKVIPQSTACSVSCDEKGGTHFDSPIVSGKVFLTPPNEFKVSIDDRVTQCVRKTTCTPTDRACVADTTYHVCEKSGEWGLTQSCEPDTMCLNGYCEPVICTANTSKCLDIVTVEKCNSTGTALETTDCSKTYFTKRCVDGACAYAICVPDSYYCDPMPPKGRKKCSPDGSSGSDDPCQPDETCQGGSCVKK
jgi:hypothetical protein